MYSFIYTQARHGMKMQVQPLLANWQRNKSYFWNPGIRKYETLCMELLEVYLLRVLNALCAYEADL